MAFIDLPIPVFLPLLNYPRDNRYENLQSYFVLHLNQGRYFVFDEKTLLLWPFSCTCLFNSSNKIVTIRMGLRPSENVFEFSIVHLDQPIVLLIEFKSIRDVAQSG